MQREGEIEVIEWEHLDKRKFYPLTGMLALTIRATVYPAYIIRTRLQVQRGKSLYSGTFDALSKIVRAEGLRGLFHGFTFNLLSTVSKLTYFTTYELMRKFVSLHTSNDRVTSMVAGGTAAFVNYTMTVPIDIVSQHLMMQGQVKDLARFKTEPYKLLHKGRVTLGRPHQIIRQIYAADGFRGFYRGYVPSLLTFIPNSAIWWTLYHVYTEQLSLFAPSECPHLIVQAVAASLAAVTSLIITNPMDVVRCRMQVSGQTSLIKTAKQMMREEAAWGVTKGLTARLISISPSVTMTIVGYETLKRLSLRDDLVETRCW